jgi:hypothetical protein
MGNPLSLQTVVDSGETLNVGDANLFNLSWGMVFHPQATPVGVHADFTEQGAWSYQSALCLGWHTVTVNAKIDGFWNSRSDGGSDSWNWWDLRDGFASTLWGVMQAVSNPKGYENYRNFEVGGGRGVTCTPEEFVDWGHYIPAAIQTTAWDNGLEAGQVTVTYSTEDQSGGDGGVVCGSIEALGDMLEIFPETSPLGAVFGAVTGLVCGVVGG